VEAALALKSVSYDRVVLAPLSQLVVGPLLYGGQTVPAIRIGDERVVGSSAIMRRLDALVSEPPLFPAANSTTAAAVVEAERWGNEVLQSVARRIFNVALLNQPAAGETFLGDANLHVPRALLRPLQPLIARVYAFRNKARDQAVGPSDLSAHLDRIDAWIAAGVIGGEQPNAADLQIAGSIRFLLAIADVRPAIETRPAAALARYLPPMVGGFGPGALPETWRPNIS
jgi:glutathione S-transferase